MNFPKNAFLLLVATARIRCPFCEMRKLISFPVQPQGTGNCFYVHSNESYFCIQVSFFYLKTFLNILVDNMVSLSPSITFYWRFSQYKLKIMDQLVTSHGNNYRFQVEYNTRHIQYDKCVIKHLKLIVYPPQ